MLDRAEVIAGRVMDTVARHFEQLRFLSDCVAGRPAHDALVRATTTMSAAPGVSRKPTWVI